MVVSGQMPAAALCESIQPSLATSLCSGLLWSDMLLRCCSGLDNESEHGPQLQHHQRIALSL